MSWETSLGTFLRETGLGKFLILLLVLLVIALPVFFYVLRVDREPVQQEHVEVINKRLKDYGYSPHSGKRYSRFVTFKFPDGSEKEFNVGDKSLDDFREGDTGILSYKQVGDGTGVMGTRFVSFENDS